MFDEEMMLEARREAAHDEFLRRAVKCADCGFFWDQQVTGHGSFADARYPECPKCGCADTIRQDDECLAEQLKEPLLERLMLADPRTLRRLENMDSWELWAAVGRAVAIATNPEHFPPRHIAPAGYCGHTAVVSEHVFVCGACRCPERCAVEGCRRVSDES